MGFEGKRLISQSTAIVSERLLASVTWRLFNVPSFVFYDLTASFRNLALFMYNPR
jgi:hypothetical protein